jgi:hypothetical protein
MDHRDEQAGNYDCLYVDTLFLSSTFLLNIQQTKLMMLNNFTHIFAWENKFLKNGALKKKYKFWTVLSGTLDCLEDQIHT